jgi:hypothetical protein
MLAPEFKLTNKQAVAHKKAEVKEMIGRLDLIAAFPHIFSTLWYSSLPCFDIRNITIHRDGGSYLLKMPIQPFSKRCRLKIKLLRPIPVQFQAGM